MFEIALSSETFFVSALALARVNLTRLISCSRILLDQCLSVEINLSLAPHLEQGQLRLIAACFPKFCPRKKNPKSSTPRDPGLPAGRPRRTPNRLPPTMLAAPQQPAAVSLRLRPRAAAFVSPRHQHAASRPRLTVAPHRLPPQT